MAILRKTLVLVLSLILTTNALANGFLAGLGPDHEYRVAVLTSGQAMTETEQKAVAEIQAKLNPVFSSTIKTFGIKFFTAVNKTEFFKILGENLDKEVGPILAKYNDKLPSSSKNFFNFYIMPWDSKAPTKEIDQLPEELKVLNQFFKVVEHTSKEEKVFFQNFNQGLENQDRNNYKREDAAYLNAISMQFKLQKDHSGFQMQILGTLNPAKGPFTVNNDQVRFEHFYIPEGKVTDINDKARMLINFSKKFDGAKEQFQAKIQFGKLAKNLSVFPEFPYAIKLEQYLGMDEDDACRDRKKYAPNLQGMAKILFDGGVYQDIDFYIFEVEIDPNVIKIDDMDVKVGFPFIARNPFNLSQKYRMGTPGIMDCYTIERATSQFIEEADAMVQEQLDKVVAPDDMTDSLLDEVLGEGNGQFTDVF
jgi:hypothetical protein